MAGKKAQQISQFSVSPSTINVGQSAVISWSTQRASTVYLNGVQVAASGSLNVAPTQTTSYRLDVDGSAPRVSSTLSLTVTQVAPPPAQTIDSFTASAASITAGQSVTLSWATSNATQVRLNGAVVAASGTMTDTPSASTTYVLEADGSVPTVSSSLSVSVVQPVPAQTIDSFTASAASIVAGQSVTVSWATSNATAVRLNGAAVAVSGSQTFSPTSNATYTLQADGSAPTISQSIQVAVSQPTQGGNFVCNLLVVSPNTQSNVAFGDSNGGIFTPIAWVFPQGSVTTGLVVANQPRLQVVPLARWRDGSLKHCAIVGVWSPVAGDNVLSLQTGSFVTGTFTASALPTDVITLGSTQLALANAVLHRTWFSTPDMIERHYRAKLGTRYVWWYVRQWSNGHCWIGRKVENNRSQDSGVGGAAGTDPYTPILDAVSVGSFSATLAHDPNSAYFVESWVVGTDPGTTYLHDPLALSLTKLVPNWIRRSNGFDEDNTNAYVYALSTYTPLDKGSHPTDWTLGGYKRHLGVVSKWEAVMAKYADARGMAWGKTQGLAINTFTVVMRNPATFNPPKPTEIGERDSPTFSMAANGVTWDSNHGTNSGYVPYLLTADFRFWETMAQHSSVLVYFPSADTGFKTQRSLANGEARGVAWTMRTLAQMLAVAPEIMGNTDINAFVTEFRALLAYNVGMWLAAGTQNVRAGGLYTLANPGNNLGLPGMPFYDNGVLGPRQFAPWMYVGYWTNTLGHLLDVDPLADDTAARAFMTWLGQATVNMLGPGGAGAYPWDMAIADLPSNGNWILGVDASFNYYATWGDVYFANKGAWRTPTNTLQPVEPGDSTQTSTVYDTAGSWLLHSISACVDYGVSGADAAFARLTGASNFADFGGDNSLLSDPTTPEHIGYGATPTEGIVPRTWTGGKPPTWSFLGNDGASVAVPAGTWVRWGVANNPSLYQYKQMSGTFTVTENSFYGTRVAWGAVHHADKWTSTTPSPEIPVPTGTGPLWLRMLPSKQWAYTWRGLDCFNSTESNVTAYSGAFLNTTGLYLGATFVPGIWLCLFGGGHGDSSDNAMRAFGPLDSDDPRKYVISQNTHPSNVWFDAAGYPVSTHTYDNMVWLPTKNWGLVLGSGCRSTDCSGPADADGSVATTPFLFDFNVANPLVNLPWRKNLSLVGGGGVSGYDDVNGIAWMLQSYTGRLFSFAPDTTFGTITEHGTFPAAGLAIGGKSGAGDVHAGVMLLGSMYNGVPELWRIDLSAATAAQVSASGTSPPAGDSISIAWDENANKWAVVQGGNATVYWLDFACTTWTSEASPGGLTPPSSVGAGTYGRFGRLPGLGFYWVDGNGRLLCRRD